MDEALKRSESLHSRETESSETSATVNELSQYAEYSDTADPSEASVTDWKSYNYYAGYDNYDYSHEWDYSQHYPTDEFCSTKDPYRDMVASNNETSSEEAPTS